MRNVEALCIACMRRVRVRVPLATKSGKFRMFYGTCGRSAGLLVTQGFVIMCGIEAAQMEKYLSRRTQEFI